MKELSVTQRAYTLRLKGVESDRSWRKKLWRTHEAVNNGAYAFGNWLLTLRGGIDHTLAGESRAHRIILALSWLSVESEKGAPSEYLIEKNEKGKWETVKTLRHILKGRGLCADEIESWLEDCTPSITASVRDDAVWVNRSAAFDDAVEQTGGSLDREEVWDLLGRFYASSKTYLKPAVLEDDDNAEALAADSAKDLVKEAGKWLSSRFGPGKGANFKKMCSVYEAISTWAGDGDDTSGKTISGLAEHLAEHEPPSKDLAGILSLISGPGYKSATRTFLSKAGNLGAEEITLLKEKAESDAEKCRAKIGQKGQKAWSNVLLRDVEDASGFTYLQENGPARHNEYSVMLDHATRRLSVGHSWIKRAEAQRVRFDTDASMMRDVPVGAKKWLDGYCNERTIATGALEGYRIRKRAVAGWAEVVKAWSKKGCRTEADRIIAARALQDSADIKFGDIQLFEALAVEEARCVWEQDGEYNHQPLIDYVNAEDALYKIGRFKVPSFRHPDPLMHPVFCDFGNSRWSITYTMHREYRQRLKSGGEGEELNTDSIKSLNLKLFTGSNNVEPTELTWQSKLFERDFNTKDFNSNQKTQEVSRASRLGRAASGVEGGAAVKIGNIFEEKYWNGRLQAPRKALTRLGRHVEKHGWDSRAENMRDNIKWLVTFSPKLQPDGPWANFVESAGDRNPFERKFKSGVRKGERYVSYSGWPHEQENSGRKSMSRLILSRIPGLRVLAVDLGHRHAAACAVWETITAEQLAEECRAAGYRVPASDDMYIHITGETADGKIKKTIYRRIGADDLEEGRHPAPWARLDRQFLIKLQGEEKETRIATAEEIWLVHNLEKDTGRSKPLIDRLIASGWGSKNKQPLILEKLRKMGWVEGQGSKDNKTGEQTGRRQPLSVDMLMKHAVDAARLALRRHGDGARIASALGRQQVPPVTKTASRENGKAAVSDIQDALLLWYGLAFSPNWADERAVAVWQEHIAPMLNIGVDPGINLNDNPLHDKKTRQRIKDSLENPAEKLLSDQNLRSLLHDSWTAIWEEDDIVLRAKLRLLKDWVSPRGKTKKDREIRNVGGLSLERIATVRSLYQLQKAFFTRLTPDGQQKNGDKPLTAAEGFGQKLLDGLDNLREQRVKQLASRIIEAALGVGRIPSPGHRKTPARPTGRVDELCQAILIENLTNYRPEETKTRRENRQIMAWASGKVKKYLEEGCELHSLHLREIPAAYTSRQDSRTGAPGIRCQDVRVEDFLVSPFWQKEVSRAEKKISDRQGDARDKYIFSIYEKYKDLSADQCSRITVRIPLRGGDLFVSADRESPVAGGIQADLNAAANIGLKALLDPDWPGRWWFVPCNTAGYKPVSEKTGGSRAVPNEAMLPSDGNVTESKRSRKQGKTREIINLWADPAGTPLLQRNWQPTPEYWSKVQARVIYNLQKERGE